VITRKIIEDQEVNFLGHAGRHALLGRQGSASSTWPGNGFARWICHGAANDWMTHDG